jgi:asparagine synthase (glutamine-hydrolysing)
VVELAWRMSLATKLRRGVTKWPLRQILYRYVPRRLLDRPKHGFGVPLATWLRGPLRDWAADLLNADTIKRNGWIEPGPVVRRWREHIDGQRDWSASLWAVLMFQSWLAEVGHPSSGGMNRDWLASARP